MTTEACNSDLTTWDVFSRYWAGDINFPIQSVSVCVDNQAFYLVNGRPEDSSTLAGIDALPGGDKSTLDGTSWGGILIDDIVISSYRTYQQNGNANGYPVGTYGNGAEEILFFQDGLRSPGVFNITSVPQIVSGIVSEGWPDRIMG
jgi:hypothetical protein